MRIPASSVSSSTLLWKRPSCAVVSPHQLPERGPAAIAKSTRAPATGCCVAASTTTPVASRAGAAAAAVGAAVAVTAASPGDGRAALPSVAPLGAEPDAAVALPLVAPVDDVV